MKPRMFISSSSESLELAYAVQHNLQRVAEITVWDQGAIKPSSTVLESLSEYLDASDFSLFVFTPDDITNIRGQENLAARDNVVLELGLFVGRIGKDRCFILVPENVDLRIPTDLFGIALLKFEGHRSDGNLKASTGPACYSIREAVERLGFRAQTVGSPSARPDSQGSETNSEVSQSLVREDAGSAEDEGGKYEWLYAYIRRDYESSLSLLDKEIEASKDEDKKEKIDLRGWRGRILFLRNSSDGIKYFEGLIRDEPSFGRTFMHFAQVYRSCGRQLEALAVIERGLAATKDDPMLLTTKAMILAELSRLEAAIDTLKHGIALDPGVSDFYVQSADYYSEAGQYEVARRVLLQGLSAASDREVILERLARLLNDNFEGDMALAVYNELVSLKPENYNYLTMRANILLDFDLYDLAMRDYKKADEIAEQKQAWIVANIGNAYKNRGFFRESIVFLKKAIELGGDSEFAHERLAQAIKMRDDEERKFFEISKQGKRKLVDIQDKLMTPDEKEDAAHSEADQL